MPLSLAPPPIRLHGLIPATLFFASESFPRRPEPLPHPAAPRAVGIAAFELFLVTLLFRWQHRVRERERQRVSIIRRIQAALFLGGATGTNLDIFSNPGAAFCDFNYVELSSNGRT